jgi:hypothetical protein
MAEAFSAANKQWRRQTDAGSRPKKKREKKPAFSAANKQWRRYTDAGSRPESRPQCHTLGIFCGMIPCITKKKLSCHRDDKSAVHWVSCPALAPGFFLVFFLLQCHTLGWYLLWQDGVLWFHQKKKIPGARAVGRSKASSAFTHMTPCTNTYQKKVWKKNVYLCIMYVCMYVCMYKRMYVSM